MHISAWIKDRTNVRVSTQEILIIAERELKKTIRNTIWMEKSIYVKFKQQPKDRKYI